MKSDGDVFLIDLVITIEVRDRPHNLTLVFIAPRASYGFSSLFRFKIENLPKQYSGLLYRFF